MRKLQLLTAAAAVLFALSGPSLAAKRGHASAGAYSAYAADRSGAYYYGPNSGYQAFGPDVYTWAPRGYESYGAQVSTPAQHAYSRAPYYGQNLPYPDRSYGDPGRW